MWGIAKVALRGKLTALKTDIGKQKEKSVN